MPSLVVIFGRDRGDHFELPRSGRLVLGRDPILPHRLNDRSISREHLQVTGQGNRYTIHDLHSRNGARVNGEKLLHAQPLEDGDIIQVGYTLLVFVRITFDASSSVQQFMNTCEHVYAKELMRMRDRAAMHVDRDYDVCFESSAGNSGTFSLKGIFKR